jgi:YD repeat-containing protein
MALAALGLRDARAYTNEWKWNVLSHNFATKSEAIAYVHTRTDLDWRYALLTVETLMYMNEESERVQLTGEPIAPIISPGIYFNGEVAGPGGNYSTEQGIVDAWIAAAPGSPQCGGTTMVPITAWEPETILSQYGNALQRERREYQRSIRNFSSGTCHLFQDQITIIHSMSVSCPSGYTGAGPVKPGCKLNVSLTVLGARNNCEDCRRGGERGNPVQAMTGDKHETEVDYVGPGGLTLIRSYHTKSLDRRARVGAGWMTNWHRSIANDGFGGFTRADGFNENLDTVVTNHLMANTPDRVQIKKIGSVWYMYFPDGRIDVYNTSGKLIEARSPAGAVTSIAYDEHGWLGTITGPFGHQLKFEYENNKVARVKLPNGLYIEYEYLGSVLTRVTYPDGSSREYHYENATLTEHLTGITDESLNRYSTFGYDTSGRATLSEHAGGVDRYQFVYNTSNTVVTDPLGTNETISFTTTSNLARRMTQSSKAGLVTAFTVPSASTDIARRVTQETDPKGNISKYTFDTYHMTSKTEAFGTPRVRTTTYAYLSTDNQLPTLITEFNRTTSFTYDGYKVLTRTVTDTTVTPNLSRTWAYTYDSYGRVLTEDGPRTDVSDVTTYTYYPCTTGSECGQLQTVTNALGDVTTFNSYNADGKPTQITDANGLVTTMAYDLRQRLTDRCVGGTLPACSAGEHTHLDYLPTGLLEKVTNPDGSFIEYHSDPAHRLIGLEDGAGNEIVYTLDNMGNRTPEDTYDPTSNLRRKHTLVFITQNLLW